MGAGCGTVWYTRRGNGCPNGENRCGYRGVTASVRREGVAVRDVQRGRQRVMGTSGWDEESWGRGRASRNGRFDGERSAGRSYDRAGRGGDSYARSYDDSRRPQSGGRGGSSGGWERN